MEDIVNLLRKQAQEIAATGLFGWGNTMTAAADEIVQLQAESIELLAQIDFLEGALVKADTEPSGLTLRPPDRLAWRINCHQTSTRRRVMPTDRWLWRNHDLRTRSSLAKTKTAGHASPKED